MSKAQTWYNGDNETFIRSSRSIEFAIYNGDNGTKIPVNNLTSQPIDLWISKDPSVPIDPYESIDVLNDTSSTLNSSNKYKLENGVLLVGFKLSCLKSNVSIHVQIKPATNESLSTKKILVDRLDF